MLSTGANELGPGAVGLRRSDSVSKPFDDDVPCRSHDRDLWFADSPGDLERAKALCLECPDRLACLSGALLRREPWGVWGGEIFQDGSVVARKRTRGRPPKAKPNEVAA